MCLFFSLNAIKIIPVLLYTKHLCGFVKTSAGQLQKSPQRAYEVPTTYTIIPCNIFFFFFQRFERKRKHEHTSGRDRVSESPADSALSMDPAWGSIS